MDREAADWRFSRSLARVAAVETILAEYATTICGRPVRRAEHALGGRRRGYVSWSIDREVVVEFLPGTKGPATLLVHDFALLAPIKRRIRTRHVRVAYSSAERDPCFLAATPSPLPRPDQR